MARDRPKAPPRATPAPTTAGDLQNRTPSLSVSALSCLARRGNKAAWWLESHE